jgi:hypoxanthine phosphoribosyltransferase
MKYVLDYINLYGPKMVKTACLYWKERSIVVPDFYLAACDNDTWIEFEWEKSQVFVLPKYCTERKVI